MMFTIKLMNGDRLEITAEEYKNLLGKQGLVFIPSLQQSVNTSSISHIFPSNESRRTEDRPKEGYLHDGTRVRKHFGQWVDADHEALDDKGNPKAVRIDPTFYPEILRDSIFTTQEWEKVKELSLADRKKALLLTFKGKDPFYKSELKKLV